MSRNLSQFEIEGKIIRETDAAILFKDEEGDENWFPLSQVDYIQRNPKRLDKIIVSEWIARQKGYDV